MIDDVNAFVKVAEVLKERGAYKVYAMATHGLLSSDAPRLIEDSCIDEVGISNVEILHFKVFFKKDTAKYQTSSVEVFIKMSPSVNVYSSVYMY
jgi:phosphoribosylpyrophosphate synthetase